MERRRKVTVVQTAHHFLYLPLHYAIHKNCFDLIPGHYEISLLSTKKGTDREAYQTLKAGRIDAHDHVDFAVADPAQLLHDTDVNLRSPVVLAGLITNSSFWAVDRRTHTVRFISDLGAFDKIISFDDGTTSYGIAKRIYKDANKAPVIISVAQGEELTTLTTSKTGTLALTPDLLGLDKLLADKNEIYHVDLVLGKTPEYNSVLVTALLSRTDVVNDHPDLAWGMIKALQRATLLVRLADPDVVHYAMDTYGESQDRILGALRRAEDAQVFPATIEVNETHWEKAGRAAADAVGRAYDVKEHDRVHMMYKSAIQVYQGLTRKAIREDLLPRLQMTLPDRQLSASRLQNFLEGGLGGLALGLLVGAALAALLHQPYIALASVVLAAGALVSLRNRGKRWVKVIEIVWLIVGLGILIWWGTQGTSPSGLATAIWSWIGIEISILLAAAAMARR